MTFKRFECHLFVTDAQPIMDYVGSMTASLPGQAAIHRQSAALRAEIETRIAADGGFHITKDTGLFIAAGA